MSGNDLIINDPVYGFTAIPKGLLTEIVNHPFFQRLGRIRQLGMASTVYPSAVHTRKQHSIGAFHLMNEALKVLSSKGQFIFDSEAEAALAAILLHDIGHGPYSHVLEHSLIHGGGTHEDITLIMMKRINEEMHGALNLAIQVFEGKYPKRFLHELICSQLDTDRLDYLCRDSFFTGVREGNIGAARIIKTIDVADDHLVVESKGIYSIENYLLARRIMYWQVYLHKTVVAAEEQLRSALKRAHFLLLNGHDLPATPALSYFLKNEIDVNRIAEDTEALMNYAMLDDSDIISSIKSWQNSDDIILRTLSEGFINRHLFKAEVYYGDIPDGAMDEYADKTARKLGISKADTEYFVTKCNVSAQLYSYTSEKIGILCKDGEVVDVSAISSIIGNELAIGSNDDVSNSNDKAYNLNYKACSSNDEAYNSNGKAYNLNYKACSSNDKASNSNDKICLRLSDTKHYLCHIKGL